MSPRLNLPGTRVALSTGERFAVRSIMSALCVLAAVAMAPLVALFKMGEGVYFCGKVASDAIRQVWATPSAKE